MTKSVRPSLAPDLLALKDLTTGQVFDLFLTCLVSGYIVLMQYKDIHNGFITLKTTVDV